MANMCSNFLKITKGKRKAFFAEIERISEIADKTGQGQMPFGIGQDYWFDIALDIFGHSLSYESKWNHNVEDAVNIAEKANVEFYLSSVEFSSNLFAEFVYKDKILTYRALDAQILDEITDDDENGWNFRGETYCSRDELCEELLSRQPYEIFNEGAI